MDTGLPWEAPEPEFFYSSGYVDFSERAPEEEKRSKLLQLQQVGGSEQGTLCSTRVPEFWGGHTAKTAPMSEGWLKRMSLNRAIFALNGKKRQFWLSEGMGVGRVPAPPACPTAPFGAGPLGTAPALSGRGRGS